MMRLAFSLIAALLASPALAQQSDPSQAFAREWSTIQASDVLTSSAHQHVAELAQRLVADYSAKSDELKKARDLAAWWEAYAKGLAPK